MINDEFPTQSERLLPTQAEYAAVMGDVTVVLGIADDPHREESTFGRDFLRVKRDDPMHLNPQPVDPLDLPDDEFAKVAQRFGPDVYRVRAIPNSLLQTPQELGCLPAGGSCAIETWGLRIVNYMKSRKAEGHVGDEDIAAAATSLLEMGPTVSHISGALLSGAGKDNVHYVESKLWTQTVAALGVEDAETRVKALYQRINQAVARRTSLINPNTVMHFIDFDELDLPSGVRELMKEIGLDYDDAFGTAEVLYTYVGPDLLARVQRALDIQVIEGRSPGLQGDYGVIGRFKQVDHNTWDSMDLPNDVMRGHRDLSFDELCRADESYPFRFGVALGKHVVATEGDIHARNAVVAGFMDTPYGGELVHMQPSLRSGDRLSGNLDADGIRENIERILTDPRRLHHGNVEQHLEYLQLYLADNIHEMRQTLAERKQAITAELRPILVRKTQLDLILQKNPAAIEQMSKKVQGAQSLSVYVDSMESLEQPDVTQEQRDQGMLALLSRMNTQWKPIDDRRKLGQEMTQLDREDIVELDNVTSSIMDVIVMNSSQFRPMLEVYVDRLARNIDNAQTEIAGLEQEVVALEKAHEGVDMPEKVKGKVDSKRFVIQLRKAELSEVRSTKGFVHVVLTGENSYDLSKAELLRGMLGIVERILSTTGSDNEEKQAFRAAIDQGICIGLPGSQRLLTQFSAEAKRLAGEGLQRIAELSAGLEEAQVEQANLIESMRPLKRESNEIGIQLADIPKPFPLNENLFISHALHFLWDNDFRLFLNDVRTIKDANMPKPEAEIAVREAMRRIFPKLEQYYLFIFGRTDERPSTAGIYQRVVI